MASPCSSPEVVTLNGAVQSCSRLIGGECPITVDRVQLAMFASHWLDDLAATTPFFFKFLLYLLVLMLVFMYERLENLWIRYDIDGVSFSRCRKMIFYLLLALQVVRDERSLFAF